MKTPLLPRNEAERLLALAEYDVLDTAAEPDFDAITTLAAQALDVPIALVSIVDASRQWFKSRYGLDAPETSRDVSFCGHVVGEGAPLVVEDAFADSRFADNPLVTGDPRVRFYAGTPLRTEEGFVMGTLCAIDHVPRTLTDRQRETLSLLGRQVVALLELRRNTRRLAAKQAMLSTHLQLFDLSPDLLCTGGPDGRFALVNPAFSHALGWTPQELGARPFTDFVHPDDVQRTLAEGGRALAASSSMANFENRYRHKDGHWVPLSWNVVARDGVFYCAARDMTAAQAKSAELEESDSRLRVLFDGISEGIAMQNSTGVIIACNRAALRILGLSHDQMIGRESVDPRWGSIHEDGSPFPGETHPAMLTLATGKPLNSVIMGVHKPDGALNWISINSLPLQHAEEPRPHAVISTFRDVTEERANAARLERLATQERLVTTGTLAAGVGHEINNPLSYILGNLEFVIEELRGIAGGSPSGRLLELIEVLTEARSGAERVRRIVRGLRALARESGPPVATDVAAGIDVAVNIATHELRQKASVKVELESVPWVLADDSRLPQVLVNLLVNAAQAFTTDDPKTNQVLIRGKSEGDFVLLSVVDNGPGIPADVLPRIFDPFFTTKAVGQGTGLGLSISQSIVAELGGTMTCETRVGAGTSFHVRLPVATQTVADSPSESGSPVRGRVMAIDDEFPVLRSIERLLRREHEVVSFTDAREALKHLEQDARFDAVFCDVMMPHMGGIDFYTQVLARFPLLAERFVFMSGGAVNPEAARFLADVSNERMEKPFSPQNLRGLAKRFVMAP